MIMNEFMNSDFSKFSDWLKYTAIFFCTFWLILFHFSQDCGTLNTTSFYFSEVMHCGRDLRGGGPEALPPCCWSLCPCVGWLCGCTWPLWTVTSQKLWWAELSWSHRNLESTLWSAPTTTRTTNATQVRQWSLHCTLLGNQPTPQCCVNIAWIILPVFLHQVSGNTTLYSLS